MPNMLYVIIPSLWGVATYKTLDDMPEKLRKALPDVKKMMEILEKKE